LYAVMRVVKHHRWSFAGRSLVGRLAGAGRSLVGRLAGAGRSLAGAGRSPSAAGRSLVGRPPNHLPRCRTRDGVDADQIVLVAPA